MHVKVLAIRTDTQEESTFHIKAALAQKNDQMSHSKTFLTFPDLTFPETCDIYVNLTISFYLFCIFQT